MKIAGKPHIAPITAIVLGLLAAGSTPAQQKNPQTLDGLRMGTQPSEFLMTKITVSDVLKSYDFYTRILGLKPVGPEGQAGVAPPAADLAKPFLEVALNYRGTVRDPLFILLKQQGARPVADQAKLVWLAFRVPNTQAVLKRAEAAGFKQVRPAIAEGRVGFLADPDGYMIEIVDTASF